MLDGAAALALAAGLLAALNPCGFALLPAYLSLLITGDDEPSPPAAVLRAVRMTGAMTAGFATVFAVFGLAIIPVASSVQQYLPWFSLSVGLLLIGVGAWQLSGRSLTLPTLWRRKGAPVTATLRSMFGFGVAYAMATLTCTIGPFLAVVVSAFRADGWASGLIPFGLYAAGMGLVVGSAAIAVALAQSAVVRGARRVGQVVPTLGAVLVMLVGGYVAYYGWWEIRILRGDNPDDPIIDTALGAQQWLSNLVNSIGATGFAVAFFVVLIAVFAPTVLRSRRGRDRARDHSG